MVKIAAVELSPPGNLPLSSPPQKNRARDLDLKKNPVEAGEIEFL